MELLRHVAGAVAPAGGSCAGKPCWKATGTTGFAYKDKLGTLAGVRKILVKRIVDDDVATGFRIDLDEKDVDDSAADFPSLTAHVTIPASDGGGPLVAERSRTCRVKGGKLACT